MYDDLPPAVLAPPSTYPPSSESEDSSESESESDRDVAVTRYGSAAPARAPAAAASTRNRILRRAPRKSPYPTETRYVPPAPERLNAGFYPRETRGQHGQQDVGHPGVSRAGSGLVLKLHLGTRGPDRGGATHPTSVGPPVSRSRGGSQGSMGGIIQQMDRMFSDVMGGGVLGAGFSLDRAGEEGSGRGISRSFSAGGGGSSSSTSAGFGTASMMSSRTLVDAGSRTLFARTERTVINADGTRETNVSVDALV